MKVESIESIIKGFKQDYPNLTEYELLHLAIQERRNQILIGSYNLSLSDSHPSALAAIAIQLGYKENGFRTLLDVLGDAHGR